MAGDAKTLIDTAAHRFLDEVPALKPLKLVVGIDLHGAAATCSSSASSAAGRGPKDIGVDARVRIEMRRDFFDLMVEHEAKVADWREAFSRAARRHGVEQYMRLIVQVVEKQEERTRTRRARH